MLPNSYRNSFPAFGVLGNGLGRSLNQYLNETSDRELVGSCPVDIREDANHLYVEADMPGFKREDIAVTLEDGVLQISAQRKVEAQPTVTPETKEGTPTPSPTRTHISERRYNRITRSFAIQTKLDETKVDAKLQDGVLHLILSKAAEVKPRKIEVK